ncbi:MAG: TIGR03435 family protein [Bryobacteraceae bacterium]
MVRLFYCVTFLVSGALAQAPEPKFEAVEIHISPHTAQPVVRGPFFGGNRYELHFANMLDLIRMAYDMDPERISGGPSWIEMDRYDVYAIVPPGSTAASRRLMLRAMLADRFKLTIRDDKKPLPAYVLTVGKHGGLKEADGSGETGCNFSAGNNPPPNPGGPIQLPIFTYTCHNTTMATFASGLLAIPGAQGYLSNKPVTDQTGLKGAFDFALKFTPKVPAGFAVTGENLPFPDALEKLGLKLETSTIPLPVIVVTNVNEKPTANPPNALPAVPTEFEVADLKPSAPTNGGRGPGPPDIKNGRLYVPGITVKNLIMIGWDLNGDDLLSGAPKWLDDDRYDLLAKAPADVALGDLNPQARGAVPVNIDALRPMIRSLVIERFQMTSHTEDRPVNTYLLTAVKPKLTKADPTERSKWQEGSTDDAKNNKNLNASLGRMVICTNVTMAQFADMLPTIASGYVRTKVQDNTNLEGGWDFAFSFSPAGALQARGPRGGGDGAAAGSGIPEASEPNNAISLFEAISKQLGLKLETVKRPLPVLVIDRIERKPTEN